MSSIFRVDIFDPRTAGCIISLSPKRVNQGIEGGLPIKLLEGKASGEESMVVGGNVIGRALGLEKVVIGGRNGVRAAGPISCRSRDVSLSADVWVFGRNARKIVEVSFLDVSSNTAGELNLHGDSATHGGQVVAPLMDIKKRIRRAWSTGLKRDVCHPSGKPIVREDNIQAIQGSGGKIGVHWDIG